MLPPSSVLLLGSAFPAQRAQSCPTFYDICYLQKVCQPWIHLEACNLLSSALHQGRPCQTLSSQNHVLCIWTLQT